MSWLVYDSEDVGLDTELDPYWIVREALSDDYQDAAPEDIEDLLLDAEIAPAVIAGIASIASSVIPLITQAISSSRRRRPRPRPARQPSPRPPSPAPSRPAAPAVSTPAMNQLLAMLTRPETIQAILSAIMAARGAGNPTARAGRESWPVGSFFTMLETLARDAAEEFRAIEAQQAIEKESHLGAEAIDPAMPEGHAYALADALTTAMDREFATAQDTFEQLAILSEAYQDDYALAEALYGSDAEYYFDGDEDWMD